MKKSLLVLNSVFAIALTWAFVYFLVFNWTNDFNLSMRDIWTMLLPVAVCGILVVPVNAVSLFLWSRRNVFFKRIFGALGKAVVIFLPILDFFYIILLTLFLVPILFEINSCLFEKSASDSCFMYFHGVQSLVDFFWLLALFIFSVMLVRWNILQVKKDKKFLLAVFMVFVGLASVVLFFRFSDHNQKNYSSNNNQFESPDKSNSQIKWLRYCSEENGVEFTYPEKCNLKSSGSMILCKMDNPGDIGITFGHDFSKLGATEDGAGDSWETVSFGETKVLKREFKNVLASEGYYFPLSANDKYIAFISYYKQENDEILRAVVDSVKFLGENGCKTDEELAAQKAVKEAVVTPLVFPAKDEDWEVVTENMLNNSSLFLGKEYKYPKNWSKMDDGAGWGGIIVFSDQKWVENSGMILEQYYWFKNKPINNECAFVINLKNTDPIFGGETDSYAKTLLTVKKYNSKVNKNEKLICDKILNFMNNEIKNRVIYYKH